MKKISTHSSRSLKWESNGELAQKDLSELIERLKNVEIWKSLYFFNFKLETITQFLIFSLYILNTSVRK